MNNFFYNKKILLFIAFFILILGKAQLLSQNQTRAGSVISSSVKGTYNDASGRFFESISQTITVTVLEANSVAVTPDQTSASEVVAPNQTIIREFRICNTGNSPNSYTVVRANVAPPAQVTGIFYDADQNSVISNGDSEIRLNQALTNLVEPSSCIKILVRINTNDLTANEILKIELTVVVNNASSEGRPIQDTGTIINSAGKPPRFTDPNDASLPPLKLVQNKSRYISSKGEPLEYVIYFRNSGSMEAKNVVVTDELPSDLVYIVNTLKINGRNLKNTSDLGSGEIKGRNIIVRLSSPVGANETARISFKAKISGVQAPGKGIVNTAKISADNVATTETTEAIVVVDPFGTVYAAGDGRVSPISGAQVSLLTDINGSLLSMPAGKGFEPNVNNANPYLTSDRGRFSFALPLSQLGDSIQPSTYFVRVSADTFISRLIRISLSPIGSGLFNMGVRALDGMTIADVGGFNLTKNEIEISSIASVAFNIPMFKLSTLEVVKTANRTQAEIGDIVDYRIEVRNKNISPIFNALVTDILPNSFSYVKNSARIQRRAASMPLEPNQNGNRLEFQFDEIASGEKLSILYRVRIGVNARRGSNYNSALASGNFGSGEIARSAVSRALVRVDRGIFSMSQFIIGRIYIDENSNNMFDAGEKPITGARVYLANGSSSVTDSKGLYSLPSVSMGAQVISIDPISIPEGYALSDGGSRSGEDWTRLVRTPLGGGSMLRQNFALVRTKNKPNNSPLVKIRYENNAVAKKVSKSDTRTFRSVLPGKIHIHDLSNGTVIKSPALNVSISVAQLWKTNVKLNGNIISNKNIGEIRRDPINKIVTYKFIGLNLRSGPNKLLAFAVGPNREPGESAEVTIYGPGAISRLEVSTARMELEASGHDSTTIFIRAFDKWGSPAQDSSVMVQTSAGRLLGAKTNMQNLDNSVAGSVFRSDIASARSRTSEQVNATNQQHQVSLVKGVGSIKLVSANRVGVAKISATQGKTEASLEVRFIPEARSGFLTGLAEVTVGRNAPEMRNREVDETVRGHVQFFYKGRLWKSENVLTLAYDSQQPLNRVGGRDRLFQHNPVDQTYPLFGDSSTRFQETESNSKVYARFDRRRSYGIFGDFDAGFEKRRLLGYSRRLTGAKMHLENSTGDFVTVTGARPDTAFARQIIPGGSLSLVQLAYADIIPGSEVLTIEKRDRRNPELIVSSEALTRSVDYNIDVATGTIFFLRQIPTFDRELNLNQVVATYEYRSEGFESSVYTARASMKFDKLGLRIGLSYINQKQPAAAPFRLGGFDAELKLPNRGRMEFEWARSEGQLNGGYGFFGNSPNSSKEFYGNAFFLSVKQPLPFGLLHFDGYRASRNFFNPFGATVTAGSTRGSISFESKPFNNSTLKVNLIGERNLTDRVDNSRVTAGLDWSQSINEKLKLNFGYDLRRFSDGSSDKTTVSNLITVGVQVSPFEKFDTSIKREQNLGQEDPSFPNQTTIGANYQVSKWAKLFFTQRLASNPITPISDIAGTGFGASLARNETAIGVETKFGRYTSLSGRYQIENGINSTDSFSIIGLSNRVPINKKLSIELGYERAFHLAGKRTSYNNFNIGTNWLPNESFRSSVRYEIRDREGFGHALSLGAAGKIKPGWTTLGRFQYGNVSFTRRENKSTNGSLALAIRPHNTDKYGLLLGYRHRKSFFSKGDGSTPNTLQSDVFSVDGFHQTTRDLELYGRFALKFGSSGNVISPKASSLTYLMQGRAQYRLSKWVDMAGEVRYLYQPITGSRNSWFGIESGIWVTPELRIGGGYNFSRAREVFGFNDNKIFQRDGFYFVVSTKVSRFFDLFGTSKKGLSTTPR